MHGIRSVPVSKRMARTRVDGPNAQMEPGCIARGASPGLGPLDLLLDLLVELDAEFEAELFKFFHIGIVHFIHVLNVIVCFVARVISFFASSS